MRFKNFLFSIIPFALACAFSHAQETVDLFLRPFDTNQPVGQIALSEIQSKDPQALIIDGEVSSEWFWIEHKGRYTGFIEVGNLTKSLTAKQGAFIQLEKDPKSAILTLVTDPKSVEIIELGQDWASVAYTGEAPVYFKKGGFVPKPDSQIDAPITSGGTIETAPPAEVTPIQPTDESIPLAETFPVDESGNVQALDEPTAITVQDVDSDLVIVSEQTETQAPIIDDSLVIEPVNTTSIKSSEESIVPLGDKDTPRYFEGKLVRNKRFNLILFKTGEYEYSLEGRDGKKLAYINTDGLIHSTPLEKYLNSQIIIHGSAEKTKSSPPLVIYARYLQLKN